MSAQIEKLLTKSEKFETDIFFKMSRQLYADCATQCEDLFDICFEKTNGFHNITAQAIVDDSRIIKVLRYCMLPVISQMKLGQLVGLDTTGNMEDSRVMSGHVMKQLKMIAPKIKALVCEYLDSQRFLWLQTSLSDSEYRLARDYSKKWTCSLIANQNSATSFRNWRKELQESSAASQIVEAGYSSIARRALVSSVDDILPGQFSRESRIKGQSVQKADLVVRLKKSKKLLLLEAKAIGVRIDAFKRIKECREKFQDWKMSFGEKVVVGTILSGFIPIEEYQTLVDMGALVFWEHQIQSLKKFVETH